ncbi:UNVERIFIED_CONTAM: hypothetical protein FKN15_021391 [Acipenser sinensis]
MPEVVEALTALSEQATEKKDGETLSSSQSLCKELTTWRFILCAVIWYNVLYQYLAELYAALGLARQQAQALAVALAQPITPALELILPAPMVAPDVTRWHLLYSAGCLAVRLVYHTGLKERGFHVAIRLVHRKYLRFTLQGSVLSFLCCGSTSP